MKIPGSKNPQKAGPQMFLGPETSSFCPQQYVKVVSLVFMAPASPAAGKPSVLLSVLHYLLRFQGGVSLVASFLYLIEGKLLIFYFLDCFLVVRADAMIPGSFHAGASQKSSVTFETNHANNFFS